MSGDGIARKLDVHLPAVVRQLKHATAAATSTTLGGST